MGRDTGRMMDGRVSEWDNKHIVESEWDTTRRPRHMIDGVMPRDSLCYR
jgi:hypothetical protein